MSEVTNEANVETTETNPQQDQSVDTNVETEDNTNQEVSTEDNTEVDVDSTEETSSEPSESDLSNLLKELEGKVKYMDKDVEIGSIDDVINNYQKGLDYERQREKRKSLENQLSTYDKLVGKLYDGKMENTEQLMRALIDSEKLSLRDQYKDKYEGEDLERVLRGDERYQELLQLDPTQFDQDQEVSKFENDVKELNDAYKTSFETYTDLPLDVREKAAETGLSLKESYKLVNFDKIMNDKLESTKKSLIAELSENKKKTTPKNKKSGSSKSYYTREQVSNMTDKQVQDNYDKVVASMKNW